MFCDVLSGSSPVDQLCEDRMLSAEAPELQSRFSPIEIWFRRSRNSLFAALATLQRCGHVLSAVLSAGNRSQSLNTIRSGFADLKIICSLLVVCLFCGACDSSSPSSHGHSDACAIAYPFLAFDSVKFLIMSKWMIIKKC